MFNARKQAVALACLTLMAQPLVRAAEPAATALPPSQPVFTLDAGDLKVAGKAASDANSKVVASSGAPGGGRLLRVEVKKKPASEYEIQYTLPIDQPLKQGDVIWAAVEARMLRTADESGQGILSLLVEQKKEPFDKLIQRRASIGTQWQQLSVPVRLTKDYPAGTMQFILRVGGTVQTLEIRQPQILRFAEPQNVKIESLPQTRLTYGGREADAAWRKAADERIEQIRKAPLTINVKDEAGSPVANATVKVEMKQHAYPFGSCYNISNFYGKNADTPDSIQYRKTFAELFNVGVDEFAMKWGFWESPTRRPDALATLKWMDDHGIRVRGHCLVWPAFRRNPEDIKKLQDDPAELARRIDQRVYNTAKDLAGRVTEWDVVNEPYANNDFMKLLGGDKVMAHWFKLAHQADPNVPLYLNETSVPTSPPRDQHYDVLYDQVKLIQADGGPISGVGMQAHFGTNLSSITDLQTIYDRFATLGVPLQITELDINTTDDQLQADYMRDLMTITFAHPNSSGIMIWGFWQGQHWRPDAALFKKDWSLKPVGQAWIDLVKKKWWTNTALASGPDGSASTRGFIGDYQITVTDGTRTATQKLSLPKAGASADVVLK